jgi:glycerophosphoryl diester phosphodiesterase
MKYFFLSVLISFSAHAFDWQGHRGARGLMPENTIEAMREGLRYPIKTLELDVVISKDKKVVVSHEPWMNPQICRHPEGKKFREREFNLYRMDYSEILRFDCGSVPYPRFPDQQKISVGKPLAHKLLTEIEEQLKAENRQVSYNIEIKSDVEQEKNKFQPGVAEFSDLALAKIRSVLPDERFVIQSFDPRVLIYVKGKYPEVTLSYLSEKKETPESLKKTLGFIPQIYSPDYNLLSYEDIPLFHAQGMKIIPWTVNNVGDMKKLIGMGVDGIITDYPNYISQVEMKECPSGSNLFEGDCVKVPAHALPSANNPGWVCKEGYVQRRFHCDRIKVPSHAVLSPDGKSWECKKDYVRYRNRCRKK